MRSRVGIVRVYSERGLFELATAFSGYLRYLVMFHSFALLRKDKM